MLRIDASALDYTIIGIYFAVVLGIGFAAKRLVKTDLDFFLSGRSLPAWITGLAFIAANLGALEILGMAANGAQYGVATVHFYWIGAIPAMVFLGLVMMPFYYGSKVRSVPEWLRRRYGRPTHLFNSLSFAVATVLISGVNLFALGLVLSLMLGWSINTAILVAALIVLVYITLGGLTSAIYNEVLQFFIILAALIPLVTVALIDVGGINGLADQIKQTDLGEAGLHAWEGMGIGGDNPLGANWIATVFGLGFVLSFGYWTTNFAEVQRALSANNMSAAQRTPLIAAYPKIFIPALVVIPGLVALVVVKDFGTGSTPGTEYNNAIPALMAEYLPSGMLGIAITGLIAAFMAGVAANVSAFNTVVTYDLYQDYIRRDADAAHYIRFGRIATVVGIGDLDLHGVHRQGLREHHELRPAAVLVLQRAAVRHVHHRHVLEAGDAVGRLRGHRLGHLWCVHDAPALLEGNDRLPVSASRRLLGSHRGLQRRRRRDRRREPRDTAEAGRGAGRARLGHGRGDGRACLEPRQAVVAQPEAARRCGDRHRRRPEHHLHLAR